jgi:hypothetical protein
MASKSSTILDDLPEEIVSIVAEYVGFEFLGLLQFVNASFRQVCLRTWRITEHEYRCAIQPFCSSVSLLKWALGDGGYPDPGEVSPCLMTCTAAEGHIEVLQWLREQDPPYLWSADVCLAAIRSGNLAALQWLRRQAPPCPWDHRAVEAAAGQIDILLWMQSVPEEEFSDIGPAPHLYINGKARKGLCELLFIILDFFSSFSTLDLVQQAVWQLGDELVEQRNFAPMIELMSKSQATAGSDEMLAVCLQVLSSRVETDDPIINEHIEVGRLG